MILSGRIEEERAGVRVGEDEPDIQSLEQLLADCQGRFTRAEAVGDLERPAHMRHQEPVAPLLLGQGRPAAAIAMNATPRHDPVADALDPADHLQDPDP